MGSNVRASAGISLFGIYRRAGGPPRAETKYAFRQTTNWTNSGTGVGVATASHQVTVDIPASDTYTLDLASFTDMNNEVTSWTALKALALYHEAASAAMAAVVITGLDTGAVRNLQTTNLFAGQCAMAFLDTLGNGILTVVPNTKIVVTNLDVSNVATVTLTLQGEN